MPAFPNCSKKFLKNENPDLATGSPMSTEEQQHLPDDLMTPESAAKCWPQIFTAIELCRAARAGNFQHIHKGRKRFVTERELMEWLHQKEVGASRRLKNCLSSMECGSGASQAGRNSKGSGTMAEKEKFGVEALRRRISKKPKSASPKLSSITRRSKLMILNKGHADNLPSVHMSRRACELIMQFLKRKRSFDARGKTSQFSGLYRAEFVKWCHTEFKHSPAYVSRMLSVVAAASKFAAKTKLIGSGTVELKVAKPPRCVPEVNYDTNWAAEIMREREPRPRDYMSIPLAGKSC
jgi:hypothetical protein